MLSATGGEGKRLLLEVEIPVGVTATVCVPADKTQQVTINDRPASQWSGSGWAEPAATVFEIGSGHYAFEVKDLTKQ